MSEELLEALIVEPVEKATASVIWLHGLGADGYDFEPIVPELGVGDLPIRFIFPHAPKRPVTVNNGSVMRAWYDITSMDLSQGQDELGTRQSERQLQALIAREQALHGIPAERVVLAGFSQGGAIVLHTGLRYPERLAGIMALSTYLPLADHVEDERHRANLGLPIFMGHGEQDPIIPLPLAVRSRRRMEELGHPVEWYEYPMPHSVCHAEIGDMGNWLRARLGA